MISVIFSTYNGEATIPATLDAMTRLKYGKDWALVVVDNGSTDSTEAILTGFQDRLPLTIICEPRRGKNKALNRAVERANGDFLIFTDDDVIPEVDWLERWSACSDALTNFSIFGGTILPKWMGAPDPIILTHAPLGMTYALTPPSIEEGPTNPRFIWGPNMAIRKAVFDEGHRFDEKIGPSSGQYRMGGETEFLRRACKAGFRSFFYPKARVRHVIRRHQLSRDWVVRRAFRYGRGKFKTEEDAETSIPRILGIPRWRIGDIFRRIPACVIASVLRNPEKAFIERYEISLSMGVIAEGLLKVFRNWTKS